MDREDLMYAYSQLNRDQRRDLAVIMGCTRPNLYRYCMKPYSDNIGKERYQKLLKFMNLEEWMQLSNIGRQKNTKPTVLSINFMDMTTPDIIMIGSQKYVKA